MAYISRDPFAREELHRESVNFNRLNSPTCDWCGNEGRILIDNTKVLYRYYIEPDSVNYRRYDIDGLFCSIGCMRTYHV